MAQTRKRRRRHRGTQAGTIEKPGRTHKGRAGATTPARRGGAAARGEPKEPTWQGSMVRAAIAAAIFGVIVVVAFGREPLQGAALAGVVFFIYVPMTYFMDRFMYRRRARTRR
jgi:hypothetical protein